MPSTTERLPSIGVGERAPSTDTDGTVPANGAPEVVTGACAGEIYTITLDSPHNRNALSAPLLAGLHHHLDEAERLQARAVVLDHNGPVFCAGADLKERSKGPADSGPFVDVLVRLMDTERPTIAVARGPVRAGGIGLLAACDLAVVHPSVTFALTEVRIGVTAAIISVPILRRVTAAQLASALLTGSPFDAAEARRIGLITHVGDDVDALVGELCAGILAGSPAAVAATKELLWRVPSLDRDAAFAEMRLLSESFFSSPDAAEGMAAFIEKRPPRWQQELR